MTSDYNLYNYKAGTQLLKIFSKAKNKLWPWKRFFFCLILTPMGVTHRFMFSTLGNKGPKFSQEIQKDANICQSYWNHNAGNDPATNFIQYGGVGVSAIVLIIVPIPSIHWWPVPQPLSWTLLSPLSLDQHQYLALSLKTNMNGGSFT